MGQARKALLTCTLFLLLFSCLLSVVGVADASVSYSMTYVANVAAGTTNNEIGSLEISIDSATAAVVYHDSVVLSLPSSPAGYKLQIGQPTLFNATGQISVTPIDQTSRKITVDSLSPGAGNTVQIVLPLTIDIPGGVNGNVQLTTKAPPSSIFSNNNSVAIAGFGIGIIRVTPSSLDFKDIAIGSPSVAGAVYISNAGFSDITIQNITITGANPGDFKLQDNNYGGKIIAPGSSSAIGVIFSPATVGIKQAVLKIFSDDPYTPVCQVSLSGNAVSASSITSTSGVSVKFNDLQGHWAAGAVARLAGMGLVSGYPDGTFQPDKTITRAEAAVVLSGMLALSPAGETDLLQFIDINGLPLWARPAIASLTRAGILGGLPQQDGTLILAVQEPVSRAEISCMIANAIVKQLGPVKAVSLTFADSNRIPSWAMSGVEIAVSKKIISGYPDGTFQANRLVTRAEAATMFNGLLDALKPIS
ncbi:MAG: S-layer homology domain-containing protein [Thermacetogeniaceae bacterium]